MYAVLSRIDNINYTVYTSMFGMYRPKSEEDIALLSAGNLLGINF